MQTLTIQIVTLVIFIVLSAFFSSAETAFSMVNRVRMKTLVDEGNKAAKRVLKICDDYQRMLSAVLIGNNIVNLGASALVTIIVTDVWGSYLVGVGTGVLTIVVLIVGEIVPKTAATASSEKVALSYSAVILFLMKVLTPLIVIINGVASGIIKVLRIDTQSKQVITENELKTYVDVSHEDGAIESGEKEMIYNVFDFSDSSAKDIMIPRIDMACVSSDDSYLEIMKCFRHNMYTRIPVYEGNDQDNVIGIINIKDLVLVNDKANFRVKNFLRKAFYTYEYKKTADLLMEMRQKAFNVAFVLNEYGATVGMITLEDLLEEIVGEIRDEYDSDEDEFIKDLGGNEYLVQGGMKLNDINDALNIALSSEDYDSLGGLMIEKLDRLPVNGESLVLDNGIKLVVRGLNRNRITKVLMVIPDAAKADNNAALNGQDDE